MNDLQCVTTLGGFILVLYALVLNAYWLELKDWAARRRAVLAGSSGESLADIDKALTRYGRTFRVAAFATLTTVFAAAAPLYSPGLAPVCQWVLIVPLLTLVCLCTFYVGGKWPL